MKSTCQITMHFNDNRIAQIVYQTLEPETRAIISDRSKIIAEETPKNEIKLSVEASDIVAVRAVVNSYLGWVEGILRIFELLKAF
ncbi:MAG: KEOPS complex subunit Pcc1 [Promethearchaeota archaeon]